MVQAYFTNPTAQRLHETKVSVTKQDEPESQIEEAKDHNGDTWKLLKGVSRNEKHPSYNKAISRPMSQNVWHNTRTGECHEGDMRHHSSGHIAPEGDMYGQTGASPRMFHISHYSKAKHVKEEAEITEAGKVHGTGGYWSKENGKPKFLPYKSYEESGREEREKRTKRDQSLAKANVAKKEETEVDEDVRTVSVKGYSGSKRQKPEYRKSTNGYINFKGGQPASEADRKVLDYHKGEAGKVGKKVVLRYRGSSEQRPGTYWPQSSRLRSKATGAAVYYKEPWQLGGRQRNKEYDKRRVERLKKEETEVDEGWAEKAVSRIHKFKTGQYKGQPGYGSRGKSYQASINTNKAGQPAGPEDRAMVAIAQLKGPTRIKYRGPSSWYGGGHPKKGAVGADIYKK
jgi:hypothetical protein